VTNFLRFGGQDGYWRDVPSAYAAGRRVLLALLGRWPSRDMQGQTAGMNVYEYVDNSPVNQTDPLGLARIRKRKHLDSPCKTPDNMVAACNAANDAQRAACTTKKFNCFNVTNCDQLLENIRTGQNCLDLRIQADVACNCLPYSEYPGHAEAIRGLRAAVDKCKEAYNDPANNCDQGNNCFELSPAPAPVPVWGTVGVIIGVTAICVVCPECCLVGVLL
jgi:RHS repeat-associated protein